jgi:hypothetical protein
MNTNQDTRTQAQKDLFKEITTELLKDIEKPHPNNGTKREENGNFKKIKEEKPTPDNPEKTHPKKPPKSMREAIQRALHENDGRLIDELCDAVLVTAINGNVPAMKIVLKLTN